MAPLN